MWQKDKSAIYLKMWENNTKMQIKKKEKKRLKKI